MKLPFGKGSGRRTNLALVALLPLAIATGLIANTIGTNWGIHPSVFHGVVAFAILILAPWKQVIVRSGLRKTGGRSLVSLLLLSLVLTTLTTGVMHAAGFTGRIGPLTLMQVHIGGAVGALILAWFHYRSHPVRMVRSTDINRRAFLRSATLTAGAAAVWVTLESTIDALGLPGGERRFTGSHERGSFDPSRLPVTSWLDDTVQRIDGGDWTLDADSDLLRLDDVEAFPAENFDAVLDCTSAWYSEQTWSGVRLDRIIDVGEKRSIVAKSQTGYSRRFPARDVDKLWLVTHVGGEPLSAGHGFPARIVAPGRRGFWWVKWVVEVKTSDVPWWFQLPFPAT